jgi:hypothetical protein
MPEDLVTLCSSPRLPTAESGLCVVRSLFLSLWPCPGCLYLSLPLEAVKAEQVNVGRVHAGSLTQRITVVGQVQLGRASAVMFTLRITVIVLTASGQDISCRRASRFRVLSHGGMRFGWRLRSRLGGLGSCRVGLPAMRATAEMCIRRNPAAVSRSQLGRLGKGSGGRAVDAGRTLASAPLPSAPPDDAI